MIDERLCVMLKNRKKISPNENREFKVKYAFLTGLPAGSGQTCFEINALDLQVIC